MIGKPQPETADSATPSAAEPVAEPARKHNRTASVEIPNYQYVALGFVVFGEIW